MKKKKVKKEKIKSSPKSNPRRRVKTLLESISKKLNEIDGKDPGITKYLASRGVDSDTIFEVDLLLSEHGYETRKAFMNVLDEDLDELHNAIQSAIAKVREMPSVVVLSTESLVKTIAEQTVRKLTLRSDVLGEAGQGLFDF